MGRNEEQEKRLDYLLKEFTEDSAQLQAWNAGNSYEEKRRALRSLMNIRMPGYMADSVLQVQDAFLAEEAREKGIVSLKDIPTIGEQYGSKRAYADKLSIWQGDITSLSVEAIVNAANSRMLGCFIPCHRCIDNAIHSAAGIGLRAECMRYMNRRRAKKGTDYEEPVGQAVLTKGYNLPADYVIHTVGPIVGYELTEELERDLTHCYENVLECCADNHIRTVAFCCISTGEFHFPNDRAAELAVGTVTQFLSKREQEFERIIFNVFKTEDKTIYENILSR